MAEFQKEGIKGATELSAFVAQLKKPRVAWLMVPAGEPTESMVQQLAADHGTARNPFRLYAIGFGPVFTGPDATNALTTLQTMQYYAGTQSDPNTALPSNQIITGTDAQMSANMIAAFTNILQKGVQVALIK